MHSGFIEGKKNSFHKVDELLENRIVYMKFEN